MLRYTFIFTTLCLTFSSVFGQYLHTVKYSKEEIQLFAGVVGMHEDEQGYLWIYGFDGISRYDGFVFEPIAEIYPESENLISKNCSSLFKDEHHLWIGTRSNGLFAIDHDGHLKRFDELMSSNEKLALQSIQQVISVKDKLFIVGQEGLFAFRRINSKYEKVDIPFLETSIVKKIFLFKDLLWIVNENGLHHLNIDNLTKSQYSYLKDVSFFVHPDGELWIANVDDGTTLHRYEESSALFHAAPFQPYKNYNSIRGFAWLSDTTLFSTSFADPIPHMAHYGNKTIKRINALFSNLGQVHIRRAPFLDSNGRLWLLGEELYLIPEKSIVNQYIITKDFGSVNDILVSDDFTYVSIRNKGLYKFNKDGDYIQSYTTENSELADNYIGQIVNLQGGKVGLCMMKNFQIFSEQGGLEESYSLSGIIRSAIEDDKFIWLGGYSNIYKIDKSTREVTSISLPKINANAGNAANAILSVDENHLKFVTADGGLMTYNIKKEEIDMKDFLSSQVMKKGARNKINDAAISPSGLKIISATDNGLFIEDNDINPYSVGNKVNDTLHLSSASKGQVKLKTGDRFFTNVLFYNDSIIYATSRKNIYRIELPDLSISTYGQLQGSLNSTYTLRSSFMDEQGNVYFGGDLGIDKIQEKLLNHDIKLDELVLGQIYHNGISQYSVSEQKLRIPSDVKVAEFKVNMPHNPLGDQVFIQGRLDNNEWTDLSSDHKMTLYNPAAGRHKMAFRAMDLNGTPRSEQAEISLQVNRKWYEHPWLWFTLGLISISCIMWLILRTQKRRSERAISELRLQEELASLKLTSLNSQMNPHFIFNALSSIQQLITSGETAVAEEYLSKFSKLLRHVIQYASHKNVKLTEELDFIKNYLDLELLRFSDAFVYRIENSIHHPGNVFIPPFFIQPQVENAIKHGLIDEEKHNTLDIRLCERAGRIVIEIEDNGQGRASAGANNIHTERGTKKGNLLTKERIDNLNKLDYDSSFHVEDLAANGAPSGTRVTLEFNREKLIEE